MIPAAPNALPVSIARSIRFVRQDRLERRAKASGRRLEEPLEEGLEPREMPIGRS
jgi:hypothetical protein